jgi:Mycothiol maleylpyruvate isomerase N-terminal domain
VNRAATVDTGSLYERIRREFTSLVVGLSDAELQMRVAATPAWSVRDVFAHVIGIATDLNEQRFPELDDDGSAWTDAQVARSADLTLRDLLAEWEREAPRFEEGLRAFGYEFGSHFVADLHAHYQDVRNALGLSAESDELTVAVALDHYLGFLHDLLVAHGWWTLEVVVGSDVRRLGVDGRCRARVSAVPFELLRALSGRRSARQIRALDWRGDVDAFVQFMQTSLGPGYSLPEADDVSVVSRRTR